MILIAVISLGAIGAVGAVFLYAASKKFEVYEDPRIAQVQEVLPGANCGGCGYPGCAGFAGVATELVRPVHVQTLMMERKVAPSPLPFTEARRIVLSVA